MSGAPSLPPVVGATPDPNLEPAARGAAERHAPDLAAQKRRAPGLSARTRLHLGLAGAGLGLGFSLSRVGFGELAEVHAMFTFSDLRLLLTFAGAVAVTAAGLAWVGRGRWLPKRPVHQGSVFGGLMFGVGWALCGACPGIVLVQLGEGRAWAAVTLVSILGGTALGGVLQRRLGWHGDSCS